MTGAHPVVASQSSGEDSTRMLEAPNRLAREFDVNGVGLHRIWVADMTYIPTRDGMPCLATVFAPGSRRCVRWAMPDIPEATLPLSALRIVRGAARPG